ncbi:hypothetical protein IscW_ISCW004286 [Ixodes scapularis]|uniref:Uncharacterized protein n=1 Tax=Ixodes scapularis TaxID=6945 RepID=B7PF51_IXOSC|nr:hypothetical protein IscW_ISCW004286 [Ixodes scapularis]|eukprot:XP_002433823.1 hypothetical protein IscW_ISCW004286 [Ixodes scapularis]
MGSLGKIALGSVFLQSHGDTFSVHFFFPFCSTFSFPVKEASRFFNERLAFVLFLSTLYRKSCFVTTFVWPLETSKEGAAIRCHPNGMQGDVLIFVESRGEPNSCLPPHPPCFLSTWLDS